MIQSQVIKLNCQNCGSTLDISQDMEKFACGYCGTSQIVERKGGVVQLKKVTDAIGKVQRGTDKTAAELALVRLPKELNSVVEQRFLLKRQLDNEYDQNWKLQLAAVVVVSFIALLIISLIVGKFLFLFSNSSEIPNIAIVIGIGSACVIGFFLNKYVSKVDMFSLTKISNKRINALANYDKKIQMLEKQIKDNYRIANS